MDDLIGSGRKGKKNTLDPPGTGGGQFSVPSVLKLNVPAADDSFRDEASDPKKTEFNKKYEEGEQSYSCGDFKKAIECFEETLKIDPGSRHVQKRLIEAITMDIIDTTKNEKEKERKRKGKEPTSN